MRDLSVEITKLVEEIHPTAFTGDTKALACATANVADALGGLFALIRQNAPDEVKARAAMRMMIERALRFAGEAQEAADILRASAAPAPDRRQ